MGDAAEPGPQTTHCRGERDIPPKSRLQFHSGQCKQCGFDTFKDTCWLIPESTLQTTPLSCKQLKYHSTPHRANFYVCFPLLIEKAAYDKGYYYLRLLFDKLCCVASTISPTVFPFASSWCYFSKVLGWTSGLIQ